ncbi:hypothetical protein [Nocardioides sp. B-3]|uniref:hypothetical protein n=1 Tax=Nocardioides sp. B-3 TaxID=2895565 RepID=UPI002153A206|nr:hypothetical protein [Nocardioides sp. B-3]UUZ58735.1 hypothetical protein LP418_21905 [Nocardioides sp. B-3]
MRFSSVEIPGVGQYEFDARVEGLDLSGGRGKGRGPAAGVVGVPGHMHAEDEVVVGDRDLRVVALHGPAAGSFGHQAAVGVGDVHLVGECSAGAGLAGASVTFALGRATQIQHPGRGLFPGKGQRLLGLAEVAACLGPLTDDPLPTLTLQVLDRAPQPTDPRLLVGHRIHACRNRSAHGLAFDPGQELGALLTIGRIGFGVLAVLAIQLGQRLLDVR